jgi:hypothetical protein
MLVRVDKHLREVVGGGLRAGNRPSTSRAAQEQKKEAEAYRLAKVMASFDGLPQLQQWVETQLEHYWNRRGGDRPVAISALQVGGSVVGGWCGKSLAGERASQQVSGRASK